MMVFDFAAQPHFLFLRRSRKFFIFIFDTPKPCLA
jgi:hypothetical protein